jgi:hypothetical protein
MRGWGNRKALRNKKPGFGPGLLFASFSGLYLQANEVFGCCKFDGADNIKIMPIGKRSPASWVQISDR